MELSQRGNYSKFHLFCKIKNKAIKFQAGFNSYILLIVNSLNSQQLQIIFFVIYLLQYNHLNN